MAKPFLGFQFKNLTKRIRQLGKLHPELVREYSKTLYQNYELVMTDAKKNFVPVDLGALRASGHIRLPDVKGKEVFVVGGFGGPAGSGNVGGETNDKDVGYAFVVHEDLTARHTVGQAKYLEVPLNRANSRIQTDLDRATQAAVNKVMN